MAEKATRQEVCDKKRRWRRNARRRGRLLCPDIPINEGIFLQRVYLSSAAKGPCIDFYHHLDLKRDHRSNAGLPGTNCAEESMLGFEAGTRSDGFVDTLT
jgi:hypothetical protein